jgi:3-oxoadipate enol-lactonase
MKLRANGIEINYEVEGDGPVVLFSHALGTNLHLWDEQARHLRDRYRVVRYDTRGHGQTSAPDGAYTLDQLADDVHGLLDGLAIPQVHYVGLSMGGMVGQTFALKYPAMVSSLALCDTTSRYPADAQAVWADRIRIVRGQGMGPIAEANLGRWFTAPFRARQAALMERVRGWVNATPPAGFIGCCHALPRINVTDRLGALTCPALVIVGEEDPGTPVDMAREIHAALPQAELAILRSASHLSNLERPEEFNRVLAGFIDKASGKSKL